MSSEEEYISELLGIDGREQCVEEVAEKEGHNEEEEEDKEEGAGGRKRKRMGGRGGVQQTGVTRSKYGGGIGRHL